MPGGSAPARRLGHVTHALRPAGSAAGDSDGGPPAPVLPLWPTPALVPMGALPEGEDPEAWLTMRQEDGTLTSPQEAMPQWFKTQPEWVHTWKGEHNPALQVFEPAPGTATGAAVIVAPGGGYRFMAPHEGYTIAAWFAEHGVTAFVLRYRLQPWYQFPAPLLDMQRAVRYVRYHKALWGLDGRVAITGFSAGGHLVCVRSQTICRCVYRLGLRIVFDRWLVITGRLQRPRCGGDRHAGCYRCRGRDGRPGDPCL